MTIIPLIIFQDDKNKMKCGGSLNFSEANSLRMQDPMFWELVTSGVMVNKARGPKHEHLHADPTAGSSFTHNIPHGGICK